MFLDTLQGLASLPTLCNLAPGIFSFYLGNNYCKLDWRHVITENIPVIRSMGLSYNCLRRRGEEIEEQERASLLILRRLV